MAYIDLNFKMTRKMTKMQQAAREFSMQVMRPAGIELDKLSDPEDVVAKDSVLWDVFKTFRQEGFHKLLIPKGFGGWMGAYDPMVQILINEQMGYGDGGLTVSLMVSALPFFYALFSPSAEVRNWARIYAEDKDADLVGCWAITEPNHGSDWLVGTSSQGADPRTGPSLTAVKKGDEYILNGWKAAWVSNGTIATHATLHVGLDPSQGIHGSGLAFCPLDLPGISRGKPLNKLGQRALNQGEIIFEDVKLHKKYMVFPIPGIYGANTFGQTFLGFANSFMGVTFSNQAQAIVDETLKFANETVVDGKLLAEYEDIRIKIFRMFARAEATRLYARNVMKHLMDLILNPLAPMALSTRATFWSVGRTLAACSNMYEKYDIVRNLTKKYITHPEEPNDFMEWSKYGISSKLNATETAFKLAGEAVQIFGEKAQSYEYPIGKMLRDAKAALIEDGVNDALALAAFEELNC